MSVFSVSGCLYYSKKHELKGYSWRTTWNIEFLSVDELNKKGIVINKYKFDYYEINDYFFYKNKD